MIVTEFNTPIKQAMPKALKLIHLNEFNKKEKSVVIKVGVFNPKIRHHSTVDMVDAIINIFHKNKRIYIVESDNYSGEALKRLQIWNDLYNYRVFPFSLSDDKNAREFKIADEKIAFSHILFKPNIFVSTHVPRRYENTGIKDLMNEGSILKNLLGLIPDAKKNRFHKKLPKTLMDIYEAIDGIDLAIMDGTYAFLGFKNKRKKILTNFFLVGKDAISVEAVGAYLMGFDPLKMPLVLEAMERGLGEGDIDKIEIVGSSIENLRQKIIQSFDGLSRKNF